MLVEWGTLHVYMCDMGLAKIKVGCSTMTDSLHTMLCSPRNVWGNSWEALRCMGLRSGLHETMWWEKGMGQCLPLQWISKNLLLKKVPNFSYLNFQQQEICRGCWTHDIKQRKTIEKLLLMTRASLTQWTCTNIMWLLLYILDGNVFIVYILF